MVKKYLIAAFFVFSFFICFSFYKEAILFTAHKAEAATAEELQQQINSHTSTISQLEAEIKQYQTELNKTSAQSKSLQSAIAQLDLNSKKLLANIEVTKNKIDQTNLRIQQLSLNIGDKQSHISTNDLALAETIKNLHESDSQSFIETMLIYPNMSSFLSQVEVLGEVQASVKKHVDDLKDLKQDLEVNKSASEIERDNLVKLDRDLRDQQTSVELNKKQEAQLLAQTKNKESNYQKIIADKKAKQKAFEQELTQYESQLHLLVNPNSFPGAHSGILAWPVDPPHIVTQYFGNTDFAAAHVQLYSGNGHNGIDIGIPIGTPIKAALAGIIKGTGDTDTACPGASFGKWVLVQHPNGLSTLYAHLSLIHASAGQQVELGDTIGYGGMTGYATGPHLHFTVYATQGVQIMSRKSASCSGATYTMPIADLKAYLNPMSYL
jgi:murein DD-endopeptidase MepM/ murein hydrolase activator NlpD